MKHPQNKTTLTLMHLACSLILILATAMCTGCNSKPSDFELASQAIHEHKTNDLALILSRNKGVVTNVSGFDDATLLHYALINIPDIDSARLLVAAGANVNQPDCGGVTPLHRVCACGARPEAVSFLLEHGANVNALTSAGETPLRFSRKTWRDPEGVKMLRNHGAN